MVRLDKIDTIHHIFILGASGFLGRNLIRFWPDKQDVLVPVNREFDWKNILAQQLGKARSFSVINCIANTQLEYCESHIEEAFAINAQIAHDAAAYCKILDVPFYQISTDGLFSGKFFSDSPKYWKIEDAQPSTIYAKSKFYAESLLSQLNWGQCIRMSFVGSGLGTSRGLITFIAKQVCENKPNILGFSDVWFSPLHTKTLTESICSLVAKRKKIFSVHQWGTYPAITKYDFIKQLLDKSNIDIPVIKGSRRNTSNNLSLPSDQSLASEFYWPLSEMIELSANSLLEEIESIKSKRTIER